MDESALEHYDILNLLGVGGMAKVYRAYDRRLKRFVALKFLRGDDPELLERFLQEARSQARVEHEHVCKVYEVGHDGDKHYIAMQYIEGRTFQDASSEMTLPQKIRVIQQVGEALNAAHRLGLIHRDIKPNNIMVEKTEDGWKSYVLDFGLARIQETAGHTVTGTLLGTPTYMSPEQARGEARKLDRRSDVFSLGVTLYEMLSGRLPFEGSGGVDTLIQVMERDPLSLRDLDAAIPSDLDTIVMKCLEKEPQRRYDSAKALADDLQRFLDGDPIVARKPSVGYRLSKKIRKHRAAFAVGALALLLLLGFAWAGLRARWQAARQVELAQQFGQDLKEIDWILRVAYSLPLHDVRRERSIVQARMKSIEDRMNALGKAAYGPGQACVGRCLLAFGNYGEARQKLENAWSSGYRPPEVAYALGLALGELYRAKLEEVERDNRPETWPWKKRQVEKDYRDPSLAYLRLSRETPGQVAAYVEALIAFFEKRYPDATQKARTAFAQVPWLYEAKKLQGDIAVEQGSEKADAGDYDAAGKFYAAAGRSYREAIEMARSDPALYESECRRAIHAMELERQNGPLQKETFDAAVESCNSALLADPASAGAYGKKAWAFWRWSEALIDRGEDPRVVFSEAVQNGRKAIALDPARESPYNVLGNTYLVSGEFETTHGINPDSSFRLAIESFQDAIARNPNFDAAYNNLGLTHNDQADYKSDHGMDPRPDLKSAIETFQRAVKINPNFAYAYSNLGVSYKKTAEYAAIHGEDPLLSLQQAAESYRRALQVNPKYVTAWNNLGNVLRRQGEAKMEHGEDPRPLIQRAMECYGKALDLNPVYLIAHHNLGIAFHTQAKYLRAMGQDPQPMLDQAMQSYQSALKINPNHAYTLTRMGAQYATRAAYLLESGQDPSVALEQGRSAVDNSMKRNDADSETYQIQGLLELIAARNDRNRASAAFAKSWSALRKAMELNPLDPEILDTAVEYCYRRAQWLLSRRELPDADLRQGLEIAGKALAINPTDSRALALRGALLVLESGSSPTAAPGACDSLHRALILNPLLTREFEPLLHSPLCSS